MNKTKITLQTTTTFFSKKVEKQRKQTKILKLKKIRNNNKLH